MHEDVLMDRREAMTSESINILLISAAGAERERVRSALAATKDCRLHLENVADFASGVQRLSANGVDSVLLDAANASHQCDLIAKFPHVPVILLDDVADSDRALVRAVRDAVQLGKANQSLVLALEKLRRAEEQLVEAGRFAGLGQLVPFVAHEINNPLALITNNLYLLERDVGLLRELLRLYEEAEPTWATALPELAQRLREFAQRVELPYTLANLDKLLERSRTGVHRIQQIVRDLLEFGRPGERGMQEADLNAGIEATLRLLHRRAEKQRVTLQRELGPLPALTCCAAAVNQIVLNLVLNGIEACGEGGTVTVRTQPTPAGAEIHVHDTGHGIDAADRERIFEPFFTTKLPSKGLGLGLSIARGLLTQVGGRLDVASAPGEGAHFVVQLPLQSAVGKRDEPASAGSVS
jgi:two-component system, NtrC family, sensor kinase